MKTLLQLSNGILLLFLSSTPCLALISISPVSPAKAKELGMEVRANPSGPEAVTIELEFPLQGELKNVKRVTLDVEEDKKLILSTSLMPESWGKPGHMLVVFTVDRAQVDKLTLMAIKRGAEDVGYQLRVKEFVDLSKIARQ